MRVGYFLVAHGGQDTGPFQKIAAQAAAWTQLGATVGLFVATTPAAAADWTAVPQSVVVRSPQGGTAARLRLRRKLTRALLDWAPDVVYQRNSLYFPGAAALARRVPVVVEVWGNDTQEFRHVSWRKHVYHLATRGRVLSRSAGLVFVTHELAAMPHNTKFRRPGIIVANGVALDGLPELAPTTVDRPRLVFLGDPVNPTNGTEQILELARRRPSWDVDVIGPRTSEAPPANVTLHEQCGPETYRPLLARADVGIGSMGVWRIGLEETAALRTREYLGCGLATILGHRDPDFPDPVQHVLQVPNTATGLTDALPAVDAFVASWHGRRVPRTAVAHLDVGIKERERLGFLARVSGS